MKIDTLSLFIAILLLPVLLWATSAIAGDDLPPCSWSGDIDGVGPDYSAEVVCSGEDRSGGPCQVSITNTGSEPWGDFHFEIYDPIGGQDISNIHFLDASMGGVDPISSQSGLTWIIDNEAVGATIDLYYCSDPVMPGETAFFEVYVDNPDEVPFYGVMFYPTPVPPIAVCCAPDGGCTLTCEYDCLPPSTWHADWDTCDPNPCEPVPVEEPTWGVLKNLYR